jgi:LysR family transcriptional regulator, nitrogen assimilation regulatory protein
MDLRALRYFVYVAEARSFSKAAGHLRIAQPALSRQVRKLEDQLGVKLVLRTGRHLELTEPGMLLLQRAHSLIRQAAQAIDDVRAQDCDIGGTVTLGVTPATCEVITPLIVQECARRHPGIRLDFVEGFSAFVFARLVNQELTACLLHNPPRHQGIEIEPLLVEPMYLVGPGPARVPGGAAAGTAGLAPARDGMTLETLPLILPNPTHAMRLLIDRALGRRRSAIHVAVQVDGYVMTKALVAAGLGYTILPLSSIHAQVEEGRLSAVRLRDPEISWTLCLAYRSDHRTARRVDALRVLIQGEVEKLVAAGKWRRDALADVPDPQVSASRRAPRKPVAALPAKRR